MTENVYTDSVKQWYEWGLPEFNDPRLAESLLKSIQWFRESVSHKPFTLSVRPAKTASVMYFGGFNITLPNYIFDAKELPKITGNPAKSIDMVGLFNGLLLHEISHINQWEMSPGNLLDTCGIINGENFNGKIVTLHYARTILEYFGLTYDLAIDEAMRHNPYGFYVDFVGQYFQPETYLDAFISQRNWFGAASIYLNVHARDKVRAFFPQNIIDILDECIVTVSAVPNMMLAVKLYDALAQYTEDQQENSGENEENSQEENGENSGENEENSQEENGENSGENEENSTHDIANTGYRPTPLENFNLSNKSTVLSEVINAFEDIDQKIDKTKIVKIPEKSNVLSSRGISFDKRFDQLGERLAEIFARNDAPIDTNLIGQLIDGQSLYKIKFPYCDIFQDDESNYVKPESVEVIITIDHSGSRYVESGNDLSIGISLLRAMRNAQISSILTAYTTTSFDPDTEPILYVVANNHDTESNMLAKAKNALNLPYKNSYDHRTLLSNVEMFSAQSDQRFLIVVCDGQPEAPKYPNKLTGQLLTKKSVDALRANGMIVFCVTTDEDTAEDNDLIYGNDFNLRAFDQQTLTRVLDRLVESIAASAYNQQ